MEWIQIDPRRLEPGVTEQHHLTHQGGAVAMIQFWRGEWHVRWRLVGSMDVAVCKKTGDVQEVKREVVAALKKDYSDFLSALSGLE